MMTYQIKIKGMSCQNCVRHVTEALTEIPGTINVKLSLEENQAVVETQEKMDPQVFRQALEEAGYSMEDVAAS
ncbi:MAG: heavy-metal-associated domain-containing protein [Deltaproteobacteria bacterium]|nr:heavy-metal-associated domain-containing protein [Deltaproteobacteria bacterium]